jgi:hypothetical protein
MIVAFQKGGHPLFSIIGQFEQNIGVAFLWSTVAYQILASQLMQIAHQSLLPRQPSPVLSDHLIAVSVRAYSERVAPFRASIHIDGVWPKMIAGFVQYARHPLFLSGERSRLKFAAAATEVKTNTHTAHINECRFFRIKSPAMAEHPAGEAHGAVRNASEDNQQEYHRLPHTKHDQRPIKISSSASMWSHSS